MLIVDKFIDGLRGLRHKLTDIPGGKPGMDARLEMAMKLHRAEKFDFGPLALEKITEPGVIGQWSIPKLTRDEISFWKEGYIPLPHPECWFEFELGGTRSGLYVRDEGDKWVVERLDFTIAGTRLDDGRVIDGGILFDDVWVSGAKGDIDPEQENPLGWKISFGGNSKMLKWVAGSPNAETFMMNHLAMNVPLAIYMALMINSKTTEVETVYPSATESRKRRAAGLRPMPPHRIVTIVPKQYRYERDEVTGKQTEAKRLHWRRSHLRHFDHSTDKAIFMKDKEHNGKIGWWVVVIPRCLVGKAELGHVTHEYKL